LKLRPSGAECVERRKLRSGRDGRNLWGGGIGISMRFGLPLDEKERHGGGPSTLQKEENRHQRKRMTLLPPSNWQGLYSISAGVSCRDSGLARLLKRTVSVPRMRARVELSQPLQPASAD